MKSSLKSRDRFRTLFELQSDCFFRVVAYENLESTNDISLNAKLKSLKPTLKQVRVHLEQSVIKVKEEKIRYYTGNIEECSGIENESFTKQLFLLDTEEIYDDEIYPVYSGKGEMVLDFSFSDFVFIELEDDEIVIKEDCFCICEETVQIEYEGDDELLLTGNGVVVIELPVLEKEVVRHRINKQKITILDEDLIFRRGSFEITQDKKSITYVGTGEFWFIPTKRIYNQINIISQSE